MMHITLNSETGRSRVKALGLLAAVPVIALLFLVAGPANAARTFTVDSTADYGDQTPGDGKCDVGTIMLVEERCTLRAAIQEANAVSGADIINFGIPTNGVATITPATALKITKPVTINGYSQFGAQPNTKAVGSDAVLKVELSGEDAPNEYGFVLGAANSTVKGLAINRWGNGIRIDGPNATGNKVTGNFIGTDVTRTQDLGNGQGVRVYEGSNNTIGGATPAERNVLSANAHSGIGLGDGDGPVTDNKITGNYIGTDKTGMKTLGNTLYGVAIEGASGTTIGGTTSGARNVISGNDGQGIGISGRGVSVMGNYVGTDATGAKALGNDDNGVRISGANNTVGGTTAGARNVISANAFAGVYISGADATGNKVLGNYLGTDRSGKEDLGNFHGVFVYDAPNNVIGGTIAGARNVASGNTYGVVLGGNLSSPTATGNEVMGNYLGTDASGTEDLGNAYGVFVSYTPNNTIGGTTAGARNVISANAQDGVAVHGDGATGNRVLSNSIFANGALGIDLGDDGPTPNDPGDADTGPNNFQNFPVLTSARKGAAGATTVRGTLNSIADGTYRVQLFSNPSGTDEGKTLLRSELVSTDGSGDASFTFSTKKAINLEQNITATATGPGGNTSEFSAPRRVVAP